MASNWIIDNILKLHSRPKIEELAAPEYDWYPFLKKERPWPKTVMMAVKSMSRHTTNEGWEICLGLEEAGYVLTGYGIETPLEFGGTTQDLRDLTNTQHITQLLNPDVLVIQDKREWEGKTSGSGFDQREKFTYVESLWDRNDIFKLTILKDAQHNREYHRDSAEEINCHGWIVYYHPRIIKHLAPYVREKHLVRTYHSVDKDICPEVDDRPRQGTIISGALSRAYPLRNRLTTDQLWLPDLTRLKHPGYQRNTCYTPNYVRELSKHKVAICTASHYGYALRKIIEATAVGCAVVTDLPMDDVLPEIDDNLARVNPGWATRRIGAIIQEIYASWDWKRQRERAERCKAFYDYRAVGRRLASDIEALRVRYRSGL